MAENAAGILGKFFQGYVQGNSMREAQKQQKVESLMKVAEQYSKWADDPTADPAVQATAAQHMRDAIMEAEKVRNEKAAGMTALVNLSKRIFGVGKKGEGFHNIGAMQALPNYAEPSATTDASSPGSITRPDQGMPTPQTQGAPQPTIPLDLGQLKTNVMPGMPTPQAQGTPQPTLNAAAMRQMAWQKEQDRMALSSAEERARATGRLGRELSQEQFTWQQGEETKIRERQANEFANSEYGRQLQASNPEQFNSYYTTLRYGMAAPMQQPRYDETITYDDYGNPYTQSINLNTGTAVGPKIPKSPTAYELAVINKIRSGAAKNVDEARRKIATDEESQINWEKQYKDMQMSSAQARLEGANLINAARKSVQQGGLSQAQALSLWRWIQTEASDLEETSGIPKIQALGIIRNDLERQGIPYQAIVKAMGFEPQSSQQQAAAAAQRIKQGAAPQNQGAAAPQTLLPVPKK